MLDSIFATFTAFVIAVGGWLAGPTPEPELGAFGDPFKSIQLATDPDNGECLTTDGTANSWSSDCGDGGSGSGNPFPFTPTNYGVSTSTTVGFTQGLLANSSSTFTGKLISTAGLDIHNDDGLWFYGDTGSTLNGSIEMAAAGQYSLQGTTDSNYGTLDLSAVSGIKTFTFPDADGTLCLTSTCANFSYPFPGNATSTTLTFSQGLLSTASTTIHASTTITGVLTASGGVYGNLTGTASLATALAANAANCSAGSFPLGVDASGAVETCTDAWTEAENTAAGYLDAAITSLGGLTAATQTFSSNQSGTGNAVAASWGTSGGTNHVLTIAFTPPWSVVAGGTGTTTNRYGGIFFGDGSIFRQASTTGLLDYDPTWQRTTLNNASTTNLTVATNLTFGGVTADTWPEFCQSITGSADLCDGSDSEGAGGTVDGAGVASSIATWTDSNSLTATSSNPLWIAALHATSTTATSTHIGAMQFGGSITTRDNLLNIDCDGRVWPASITVGGCVHLNNGTVNTGPALELVSGVAASATSLLQLNVTHNSFAHSAIRADYDGAGDAVTIDSTATVSNALAIGHTGLDHSANIAYTGTTANKGALNLTGTNAAGSLLQVTGPADSLGLAKLTHNAVGDADASVLSLAASNSGYLGQGIFLDMATTSDTQKLINFRAGGAERLSLTANGLLTTRYASTTLLSIGSDFISDFSTGLSISAAGVVTVTDVTCTDCLNATEIEDIYLLNNGDVGTGVYDFGGATSVEIPNGGPTVDTTGEIGVDTTSGQFKWSYNGSTLGIHPPFHNIVAGHATATWAGTTTQYLAPSPTGITVVSAQCETSAGTVGVSLYDGTNRANFFTASTTIGTFSFSTNNTFTAGESMRVDFGTPASSPTQIACRFRYTTTAD